MLRKLSSLLAVVIFLPVISTAPAGYSSVSTSGLVSWWSMDNTSDSGPSGHTLTLNGVTFQPGKVGSAAHISSFGQTLSSPSINFTGPITVAEWYRADSARLWKSPILADGTYSLGIDIGNQCMLGYISYDWQRTDVLPPDRLIADNSWTFLVIEWDPANEILYISKNAEPFGKTTAPIGIGTYSETFIFGHGDKEEIAQDFDEVSVWNRLLTQGEITTLYNEGKGLSYSEFMALSNQG